MRWSSGGATKKAGARLLLPMKLPVGSFVHFSAIQMDGYKTRRAGQKVEARFEGPLPFDQDGYRFRATAFWPLT
jgi:'Cold-shock' DNA-binding domain